MLPLAHVGHYLWVFYLLPVLFVIAGIARTALLERRGRRQEDERKALEDLGEAPLERR
jgi:hypothetical protein